MRYVTRLLLVLSAVGISQHALAHFPVMSCQLDARQVRCETGFSDGSLSVGKPVTVLDYDEQVLLQLTTDAASAVEFTAPEGEYYIRFDSGHEQPVEVDYDEL